jgi:hypothetical protein
LIEGSNLLLCELLRAFFVEIAELYFLLERLDLFVFIDYFVELDGLAHFLILSPLQLLAQLFLGNLEVNAVCGAFLPSIEACRCHIEFVTYQII